MIGGGRGTGRGGGMAVTVHGVGLCGVVQAAVHGPARGTPMADAGPARALAPILVFLVPCLFPRGPVVECIAAKRDQGIHHGARRKSVSSKRGNRGWRTRRRAGLR